MKRRTRIAVGCTVVAGFATVLTLTQWLSAPPLALSFLFYTNINGQRIPVMELSNRTDSAYQWSFHSRAKAVNHLVAVTEIREKPNEEFRHVCPYSGDNLFGHDTVQFGTDDFRVGEQFWVEAKHYPKSSSEVRREKLSGWLWSHGLRFVAPHVQVGQQIHGPVLPPDNS